ncbi:diguanylate cyclase (GGDEF)-like protein [Clostridium punense]|uniref:Diguanylate cyclase (GGDEF)-like protein n=1 Tax=Clostridium punense TaxID=1054297 RepID=A0ABS4K8B8_9CLOT|nr:sensor domain-containing diguanylate cyclase [Clostridium punense]MBP2024025.1 diguanylate cyclase (GGDEF)-like protein [Clostridium punense]
MDWVCMKYVLISILFILVAVQWIVIVSCKSRINYLSNTKDILYYLREKVIDATHKSQVYELILRAAIDMVPKASKGSILMVGEDNLFHYEALVGYNEELKNIKLRKEEVFLYAKNKFQGIAVIKNPSRFNKNILNLDKHKIYEETESLDICCTLSSPIAINNKVMGVINLDSTKDGTQFSEEDIRYLKYIINELRLVLKVFLMNDDLRYQANFDVLTGIYNRRYLEYLINYQLEMCKTTKEKPTLIFIDLDNFKAINDTYGHGAGDKALIFIANILRMRMDSSYIFGRMAGDEFIIFIPNGDEKSAVKIIEEIRESYKKEKIGKINLDFSYGIVQADDGVDNLQDLVQKADEKMYEVKNIKKKKTS